MAVSGGKEMKDINSSLGDIFSKTKYYQDFDVVYLSAVTTPSGSAVRHYPFDSTVEDFHLETIKDVFIFTLENEMAQFKGKTDERGTVYFSPANRFNTVNTEAKELYGFQVDDSIMIESNFIVE
ncbi:hypothetical protein D3C85_933380 [compost metagenome]